MIPFSPPKVDQRVIDEVIDALNSGWITTGPKTKILESKVADYVNSPAVLCVNSCTSGLFLMLKWFGIEEGDEIIMPSYTFVSTANAFVSKGAVIKFVDSYVNHPNN